MNDKRVINDILKNYGKGIHKAHIDCVKSHLEERPSLIGRISYHRMVKRCLIAVLILVLTFSLLIVGTNAMGIKLLNLSFLEKETYTQVTNKNGNSSDTDEFKCYEPGYIPNGYTLEGKREHEGESVIFIYSNEQEEYLYVDQSKADTFSAQMDNEDCDISTDTILDMEVRIYRYSAEKQDSTYLLKKGGTYIQIVSVLPDDEVRQIIYNLN